MWYFDEQTLLLAHYKLIERFGGSHGVRELERVRSVIEAPKFRAFGQEHYSDVFLKAAVYSHNIIGDHPFVDGNKRTGMTCALMFLRKNGIQVLINKGELEDFAVLVATDKLSVEQIADWLKQHTKTG